MFTQRREACPDYHFQSFSAKDPVQMALWLIKNKSQDSLAHMACQFRLCGLLDTEEFLWIGSHEAGSAGQDASKDQFSPGFDPFLAVFIARAARGLTNCMDAVCHILRKGVGGHGDQLLIFRISREEFTVL